MDLSQWKIPGKDDEKDVNKDQALVKERHEHIVVESIQWREASLFFSNRWSTK